MNRMVTDHEYRNETIMSIRLYEIQFVAILIDFQGIELNLINITTS